MPRQHAAPHEAGQVGELEAAQRNPILLGDDHFLVGIGVHGCECLDVVPLHRVSDAVVGWNDAVLDDEPDDERKVGGASQRGRSACLSP